MTQTQDLRVESLRPLISPAILREAIPLTESIAKKVAKDRAAIAKIVHGKDARRLLVVVGPCSIHDSEAALDYAERLKKLASQLEDELLVVMRSYFEKPRTTVGWKGLINDPRLDGSFAINEGLHVARKLLADIVSLGLPVGCEFLDPISPQFTADLVSWGAIGARTTESQVHRELASGLSMPVGFKNGTDGNVRVAVDGVISARHPHRFLGVTEQGLAAIVSTRGNPDCHIILRGSSSGPNYHPEAVQAAAEALQKSGVPSRVMVDASHGNSNKDHRKQVDVARSLGEQVSGAGRTAVFGVMMESFLAEGRQDIAARARLKYGQSVTDACMSWSMTERVLRDLGRAVKSRTSPARPRRR